MAEASLIFNEEALDKQSGTYALYSRFLENMRNALLVDSPDIVNNPPLTPDGEIDNDAIAAILASYSEIQMKNSAYSMANAIMLTVEGSGGGSGSGGGDYAGLLSRSGDSMTGMLGALYGFQAGASGQIIFNTAIDANNAKTARVYGNLVVDGASVLNGAIYASNNGIYFNNNQSIYYADNALYIKSGNIKAEGTMVVDGSLSIGDTRITDNGIYYDGKEYYHSGNANLVSVDWSAKNLYASAELEVDGPTILNDTLTANYGFSLGVAERPYLYSGVEGLVTLAADLSLTSGHAIKIDNKKLIHVRSGADNILSLSAPGMVLNLGDSDGSVKTERIALQSAIWNYNSGYKIISEIGDGNFPNSFSAGCGNASNTALRTYYVSGDNYGVVSYKNLRLGSSSGPAITTDNDNKKIVMSLPFSHMVGSVNTTEEIQTTLSYSQATSLFRNSSLDWSAIPHFTTQGEYFVFDKWVEAPSFTIISERYKTRLMENVLFFGDGTFIEGMPNGMYMSGNTQYAGNLSSRVYTSGFAGSGWSIEKNNLTGNIAATFDELTIRKNMRIYELEVQKISATNGSLWVSDSCSGDKVELLS